MRKENKRLNRIMFAAPRSGSGKTMITCGFLNLFKRRGLDITSYKCGPDYIDPMFHRKVLGIVGGNLDTYFCDYEQIMNILSETDHEYAVLEGVMGVYDGLGGIDTKASSMDVAIASRTPIILIVDAYGSGRTVISLIKGILSDDKEGLIKGIILNRVSDNFYDRLKPVLEEELNKSFDVKILGYLPVLKDVHIDSRHLGLISPDEIHNINEQINLISDQMEKSIAVDDVISIMNMAEDIISDASESVLGNISENISASRDETVGDTSGSFRIAVARDEAFSFYYQENLKLLEIRGIEIVYFSPLHDKKIPDNVDGVLLGGGYPENYLPELSKNKDMLESVKKVFSDDSVFSLAECGGFMYLHNYIESEAGTKYQMAGVIQGGCKRKQRLVRFGYIESDLAFKNTKKKYKIRGHEFHYYDSTDNGEDGIIYKAGTDISWKGMHITDMHVWGFPHFYYMSCPEFVDYIYECMEKKHGRAISE